MAKFSEYFRKRLSAFGYAFNGIAQVIRKEANFRIHLFAAVLVIVFGFIVELTSLEWLAIILTIGLVMAAEIFNSAIEQLTDLIEPEHNKKAGLVKDIAAGAVLITAIMAVVIGLIIFIPKLIN